MKIGTANIQNLPDMNPHQVASDGRLMGENCHVWGGQEIAPEDGDCAVIMAALPPRWRATHRDTSIPIFWDNQFLELKKRRRIEVAMPEDLALVRKPRLFTAALFKVRTRPNLRPFWVVNVHFIANAYNSAGWFEGIERRKAQYDREMAALQRFEKQLSNFDRTVFTLGDFNDPQPEMPHPHFKWLAGERLDRVGVTTNGSVKAEEINDYELILNSDHNGQVSNVRLSPRR